MLLFNKLSNVTQPSCSALLRKNKYTKTTSCIVSAARSVYLFSTIINEHLSYFSVCFFDALNGLS